MARGCSRGADYSMDRATEMTPNSAMQRNVTQLQGRASGEEEYSTPSARSEGRRTSADRGR